MLKNLDWYVDFYKRKKNEKIIFIELIIKSYESSIFLAVNMPKYTSASYQQDLIDSLKKKLMFFWGPGYENFDINLDLSSIKKLFISDNDCIIVGPPGSQIYQ